MTKIIIWDRLASKKRDEFATKNYVISNKFLDDGEEKLRDMHEYGLKAGKLRKTLLFGDIYGEPKKLYAINYIYIYNSEKNTNFRHRIFHLASLFAY